MMADKFAIVTGASVGIGLELARLAAKNGYDLLVVADTPFVDASAGLGEIGVSVETLEADLASFDGVDRLLDAAGGDGRSICSAPMPAMAWATPFSTRNRPSGGM